MSSPKKADDRKLEEERSEISNAFLKILIFAIGFPVFGYFISKALVFEAIFGLTYPKSSYWAAGVAIALVQLALLTFIITSFREKPEAVVKKTK